MAHGKPPKAQLPLRAWFEAAPLPPRAAAEGRRAGRRRPEGHSSHRGRPPPAADRRRRGRRRIAIRRNRLMAAGLPSTSAILADVRSRWGSDVLISFSRGKDAVATALALNEAGFRVSGLYYYSVPPDRDGKLLSFESDYLDYAAETLFGGRRVIQLPSPWLIDAIRRGTLQSPVQIPVVMALQGSLQPVSYWDLHGVARFVTGLSDAPVAIGTRASDSPGRRIHFRKVGPVDVARRTFSPIRSEEHTSELQSLMRISYAVFCLKKKISYILY